MECQSFTGNQSLDGSPANANTSQKVYNVLKIMVLVCESDGTVCHDFSSWNSLVTVVTSDDTDTFITTFWDYVTKSSSAANGHMWGKVCLLV